jgi:hypothetical protein
MQTWMVKITVNKRARSAKEKRILKGKDMA